jgi:hypothetical protein
MRLEGIGVSVLDPAAGPEGADPSIRHFLSDFLSLDKAIIIGYN